jgi:hypothetical protein
VCVVARSGSAQVGGTATRRRAARESRQAVRATAKIRRNGNQVVPSGRAG